MKLKTIPKQKIDKMTREEVLSEMQKVEHVKVFTDETWSNLEDRIIQINDELDEI